MSGVKRLFRAVSKIRWNGPIWLGIPISGFFLGSENFSPNLKSFGGHLIGFKTPTGRDQITQVLTVESGTPGCKGREAINFPDDGDGFDGHGRCAFAFQYDYFVAGLQSTDSGTNSVGIRTATTHRSLLKMKVPVYCTKSYRRIATSADLPVVMTDLF